MSIATTVPAFAETNQYIVANEDGWYHIGSGSEYVSWTAASTANDIAHNISYAIGLVCLVSPYWGANAILTAIGPTNVANWIGRAGGGYIYLDWYQMVSFGTVSYKIKWRTVVDGKVIDCKDLYWVANPYYSLEQ